jgi:hypothetical protein
VGREDAGAGDTQFAAIIRDFRLVFAITDATHLLLKVEGHNIGGLSIGLEQRSAVVTTVD